MEVEVPEVKLALRAVVVDVEVEVGAAVDDKRFQVSMADSRATNGNMLPLPASQSLTITGLR